MGFHIHDRADAVAQRGTSQFTTFLIYLASSSDSQTLVNGFSGADSFDGRFSSSKFFLNFIAFFLNFIALNVNPDNYVSTFTQEV